MKSKVLVDSSYLFTIYDRKRRNTQAVEAARGLYLVIPQVILVEVCYLLTDRGGGINAAVLCLEGVLRSGNDVEALSREDLQRAKEIMQQYADAKLDFVDCCLMALSERLNITKVLTFDRRDFSIFRPKHCEYLELLP